MCMRSVFVLKVKGGGSRRLRVCWACLYIWPAHRPQLMLADSLTKETCDVCMNTRQVIYTVGGFVVCVMLAELPESEAETEVSAGQ